MRKPYSSDITRKQFDIIKPHLESAKKKTKPREVDLYDVFCGILYLLKNGCTWHDLPHDLPDYKLVNYYYGVWSKKDDEGTSILDQILAELVNLERRVTREKSTPSMLIVDSKSIKNADTAEEKGYDAGKKISGVKLHIGVDVLGLPYAACVTTANVTDRNGAIQMFSEPKVSLETLKTILADGTYTGKALAKEIKKLTGATVKIAKRPELHEFSVIPKRWIVERSFAWLDKCRRLWKNCERHLQTTLDMVTLAFSSILLQRF